MILFLILSLTFTLSVACKGENEAPITTEETEGVTAETTGKTENDQQVEVTEETRSIWSVAKDGSVIEIAYGSGTDFPQYAALHLESSYFRMNYGPGSGWGTSVILLPAFWEETYPEIEWELVPSPGYIEELTALDDIFFTRTEEAIFKSGDLGGTWEALPIGLDTGPLHAIEVDSGKLYAASKYGVIVSEDSGESFSWLFDWTWDDSRDVDFQNDYGWLAVDMWGSRSGPNRKIPEGSWECRRGNIPWDDMSMTWVVVDPLDPGNIAYVGGTGYRTLDGGDNWLPCPQVIFCTVLDGIPIAFGRDEYSQDRGETWQSLGLGMGIYAEAFTKDEATGFLFVAKSDGGVLIGRPGQWRPFGLPEQEIQSITISGNWLLAASTGGEIFRTNITDIPPVSTTYNQGAPVSCTWRSEGEDLVLAIDGMISGLNVSEEARLSPPTRNSFSADINVAVDGNVELANHPGEAFKPLMLSSMHISTNIWDIQSAYLDSQSFEIPVEGWIIQPPAEGRVFGLEGGTSDWKENAPTIEVTMEQPFQVTGWVNPSSDPNDENIGFWAALDKIVLSWKYTITAKS